MTEPRPVCARCRRPTSVCYCAALPELETRTRVVILQHPRERTMPIGTARMASLCLPEASLHVGVDWGEHPALRRALADPARPPILLYPGPTARDILAEPPQGPVTLVVVDGTWSHAKIIVRENPVLRALPRYGFVAPEPTEYRIRREPRAEYVSTIEALMHVLGILEGDRPRFRALLDPLRAMVDRHLAQRAGMRESRSPRRAKRGCARPRAALLPRALLLRPGDLVCAVGEGNVWPYRDGVRPHDADLVHWVARRIVTGEHFDAIAAPRGALCPSTAPHIELPEARLLEGMPVEELVARFGAFLRPSDVLCTWGRFGLELLAGAGGQLPAEILELRSVARRLAKGKVGSLEDFGASLGGAPEVVGEGRANRRLAVLAQVVQRWLQAG